MSFDTDVTKSDLVVSAKGGALNPTLERAVHQRIENLLQRSPTKPSDEAAFRQDVLAKLGEKYRTLDREDLPMDARAFFELVDHVVISCLAPTASDDIVQIARNVLKADLAFLYLLSTSGSIREAARRTKVPRNTLGRKIAGTLTLLLEELEHAFPRERRSSASDNRGALVDFFNKIYGTASINEEGERDED